MYGLPLAHHPHGHVKLQTVRNSYLTQEENYLLARLGLANPGSGNPIIDAQLSRWDWVLGL